MGDKILNFTKTTIIYENGAKDIKEVIEDEKELIQTI